MQMVKKEYKEPDVKGPRFKQGSVNIINDAFVKEFKEKYPKYKDLSKSEMGVIIRKYNETVWKEVIENRDGVQLPEGVGILFIATCKSPIRQNIDFSKSKKYGVTVTNKNWETDGKLAKIFYTNYNTSFRFQNRECYGFIACRDFKRTVAKVYPENWNMYVTVEPTKKLRDNYKKQVYKEKLRAKQLIDYNEFDL
jgi:hypothetical protein